MAKYKQRKDGRYYTLVSTGKHKPNGKPIRIPVYGTSSRDLERKVAAIQTDLDRGTYAFDKNITLGKYANLWLEAHKKGTVSHATEKNYYYTINKHFDLIEDIKLQDLTKTNIMVQINKPENTPEIKKHIIMTIKQILETAIDDGLVYRNVARSIKAPAAPTKEKRALTPAEKVAIKKCDFTPMEKVYVDILYCCGLRRGELLALQRQDVDFITGNININKSLSFSGGSNIKEPKSKAGRRAVPMPDWLAEELKAYIKTIDSMYLFHSQTGALISESTAKRMWNSIFNKINVAMGGTADIYKQGVLIEEGIHATDITPHIFRHNYATMLFYSGMDLKEAQRLLGHSSIKITLEIYTHLMENPESTRAKINQIAL